MKQHHEPIKEFAQWYVDLWEDAHGRLRFRDLSPQATSLLKNFRDFKKSADARLADYDKLEQIADAAVAKEQEDLANVSSGETAGLLRRIARTLVQNTPNVDVVSIHDDDSVKGVLSQYMLSANIISDGEYSNDMQQNLYASTVMALAIGFSAVLPTLVKKPDGGWRVLYDELHYRDVFPEPGVKDIRRANDVFVRKYLTKGDVLSLIERKAPGWNIPALKALLEREPRPREYAAVDQQSRKHKVSPKGYSIITWYSSSGDPFLTFAEDSPNHLLRIEKNKVPSKEIPLKFLVLEKDPFQPFGKSQVSFIYGRQVFQDLMLNGAMKMWYRNINPPLIGFGALDAVPNLSPGKYTKVSNPNARIEAFEVNTQTLMQYNSIAQQNFGAMVNQVGSPDEQMATQSGHGFSATPQGVEAQTSIVNITTNNYQKAIESFFSQYCSYALTMYFHELASMKKIFPTADTRKRLLDLGMPPNAFQKDGSLEVDFKDLATEYYVRCVPGSLVEVEDEKQTRILGSLFTALSQALPAIAQSQDPEMLTNSSKTLQFILQKMISLSGSTYSTELASVLTTGEHDPDGQAANRHALEANIDSVNAEVDRELEIQAATLTQMNEQIALLRETQEVLLEKLGVLQGPSDAPAPQETPGALPPGDNPIQ